MSMRRHHKIFGMGTIFIIALVACVSFSRKDRLPEKYKEIGHTPRMHPDYSDTVIPPNIAPLNFMVLEPGLRYLVSIHSTHGKPITVFSKNTQIRIPLSQWKKMLSGNPGQPIVFDVYVEHDKNEWSRFNPISIQIANEKIDSFLSYRLIEPQYKYYNKMGLYQRDLEDFSEKCFLNNQVTAGNCMNCHTFYQNQTDKMIFHMRGGPASGTMLIQNGKVQKINTSTDFNKAGAYASWHPNGQLIAFSVNKLQQFFHAKGESRDVLDRASDLIIYQIGTNTVTTCPMISDPERLETFPSWAPDGKALYFCSAPKFESFYKEDGDLSYKQIKYDLMRIPYDAQTERFGKLETVLSSSQTHKSITMPRVSPDGKYLLFCMASYSNFPIYIADCDLYVMDIQTGKVSKPGINSDHASDTYHSWSSNSRWVVFSSKRDNGFCARPYIAYIDKDGEFHKPFILPQKDPSFYDTYLITYNVPELTTEPVHTKWQKLTRVAFDNKKTVNAKLDPRVKVDRTTGATPEEDNWVQKPK